MDLTTPQRLSMGYWQVSNVNFRRISAELLQILLIRRMICFQKEECSRPAATTIEKDGYRSQEEMSSSDYS